VEPGHVDLQIHLPAGLSNGIPSSAQPPPRQAQGKPSVSWIGSPRRFPNVGSWLSAIELAPRHILARKAFAKTIRRLLATGSFTGTRPVQDPRCLATGQTSCIKIAANPAPKRDSRPLAQIQFFIQSGQQKIDLVLSKTWRPVPQLLQDHFRKKPAAITKSYTLINIIGMASASPRWSGRPGLAVCLQLRTVPSAY